LNGKPNCHFLSYGNARWEQGRQAAQAVKPYLRKMESNVAGSFLERHTWQSLLKAKRGEDK
jgi:hypothetical protein